MKFRIGILAGAIVTTVLLLSLPAMSAGSNNTISGCVNKKTGILRISSKCTKTESKLTWMVSGLQGPSGQPGSKGDPGSTGPTGATGATGPRGADGNSAVEFASDCYQKLMQAENSGYIWGLATNVQRFQELTDCKVRDINLNPNSRFENFNHPGFINVTSTRLLGSTRLIGDENPRLPLADLIVGIALYEVNLDVPESVLPCSIMSSSSSGRVFRSPTSGKYYATGDVFGDHRKKLVDLVLGSGELITENSVNPTSTDFLDVETVTDQGLAGFVVHLRDIPADMALGSTQNFEVLGVWYGDAQLQDSEYRIAGVSAGALAGATWTQPETSATLLTVTANQFESGKSALTIDLEIQSDSYGYVSVRTIPVEFNVGAKCRSSATDHYYPGNPFKMYETFYRFIETLPIANDDTLYAAKLQEIGWNRFGWFADLVP